jgi:hypothetical protein
MEKELTESEIIHNLGEEVCLSCGGKKQELMSFCKKDYFALPPRRRSALYRLVGEGYVDAFRDALKFLAESK